MHLLEILDCSPQDRLSALFLVLVQKSPGFARLGHEILVPTILKDHVKKLACTEICINIIRLNIITISSKINFT